MVMLRLRKSRGEYSGLRSHKANTRDESWPQEETSVGKKETELIPCNGIG